MPPGTPVGHVAVGWMLTLMAWPIGPHFMFRVARRGEGELEMRYTAKEPDAPALFSPRVTEPESGDAGI